MDTMQLIEGDQVLVYTLKKGITDTILYNETSVFNRYGFLPEYIPDYKGLRGDTSDNIIGIKGIGEKTATTLITLYGTIEKLYDALKKNPALLKEKAKITDRIVGLLQEGEDEALFSKELATIRRDAPIEFVTPIVHRETYNSSAIVNLCEVLEFRSLIPRVKALYTTDKEHADMSTSSTAESGSETTFDEQKQRTLDDTTNFIVDRRYLLAVSLLDSENIHPSVSDILAYSSDGSIESAYSALEQSLHKEEMYALWSELEVPLLPIVDMMSSFGIAIDTEYFKNLSSQYHAELTKLESRIWELVGQEFNINSPKQLGEILFNVLKLNDQEGVKTKIKKTTTGVLSTKESELEKLKGKHPVIEYIFEYRELQKLLSTYIDVIPTLIGDDGRIHSTFNQLGAATGRFSSNEPNLQNIPIKTEKGKAIRRGFVSAPGYTFIGCDYSQIELRIAALLSQDKILLTTFIDKEDIHTRVATRVFSVSEAEVTAEMRRRAKVINFGILYGMGATALAQNLGVPRKEAQQFLEHYKASFPELNRYLENVLEDAKKNLFTKTFFGRKRNFKKIRSHLPFIRAMYERMAINAPIQGTAADVIKRAMINVEQQLVAENLQSDVRLVLQIHDEIIFEVKNELLARAQEIIVTAMEGVLSLDRAQADNTVLPLLEVHVSTGTTWGELK